MKDQIKKLFSLKEEVKNINKELKDKMSEYPEYQQFADDLKETKEVYNSFRNNLISTTPDLGALDNKKRNIKNEIKILMEAIKANCMVVDKSTGEAVQLSFNF
jgi:chromosome segregation ATPase